MLVFDLGYLGTPDSEQLHPAPMVGQRCRIIVSYQIR